MDNLKDTVTKCMEKSGYLDGYNGKTGEGKKKPSQEMIDANATGMSVMVCGALMMSSPKALNELCKFLGTDAKKFASAIKANELKLNFSDDKEKKEDE